MSLNHSSFGVFGQDWPGWPRISRSDPVGRGGYVETSPANWRGIQQFLDGDFSQKRRGFWSNGLISDLAGNPAKLKLSVMTEANWVIRRRYAANELKGRFIAPGFVGSPLRVIENILDS